MSIWFARNCFSGEFYFSPCGSGFVSKLVFIFSCANCYFSKAFPSPSVPPTARSFAGFSLVGTFLYIFYSERPILLYFPPFLSTLPSERHLSSGPLWLVSLPFSYSIISRHSPLCYPKRMFAPLKAAGGLQLRLSCRGPAFNSQDPHGDSQPAPEEPNGMHVVYTRVCKEDIHTHKFPLEGSGRQHLLFPALISLERHPVHSWHTTAQRSLKASV